MSIRALNVVNRFLAGIFLFFCLILLKEYITSVPQNASFFVAAEPLPIDFNVPKTEWSYYSNVFKDLAMPVCDFEKPLQPVVSLPLVLKGIILSSPAKSFAIIEDIAANKQDLYRLGDFVKGAKIVSMSREKVVLDYEGNACELTVSGEKLEQVKPPVYHKFSFASVPEKDSKPEELRNATVPDLEKNPLRNFDFSRLLTQLRIRPYFENGKCIGFQLDNINSSFMKQMGLKDGDIVQSINGVKIDDPLKALQILYGIQNNNPVHLGVGRGNEQMEMDCKIEG
jgi:general secretion pathway protein C